MRMHTGKIFNVVHMSSFPLFFTSNNHVYHVLTYVVEMFGICESLMTHIKTLKLYQEDSSSIQDGHRYYK